MQTLSMHQTQHLLVAEPAWLTALGGKLWVTRRGDPADYILAPGERLALARGDDVTLGGWESAHPALWDWQPAVPARRYRFVRDLVAGAFGLAARGLRAGAEALAALARNAASIACRAQGCIS
jgi:hypothetical protein